jgi:hypothetical protein
MLINHVALRGLIDPDKLMQIDRIEDEDGNPQDSVQISIRQILLKHKINYLPLWQSIPQNDDGSWCGYYSMARDAKDIRASPQTDLGALLLISNFTSSNAG